LGFGPGAGAQSSSGSRWGESARERGLHSRQTGGECISVAEAKDEVHPLFPGHIVQDWAPGDPGSPGLEEQVSKINYFIDHVCLAHFLIALNACLLRRGPIRPDRF
jgi:hypothetical protein